MLYNQFEDEADNSDVIDWVLDLRSLDQEDFLRALKRECEKRGVTWP